MSCKSAEASRRLVPLSPAGKGTGACPVPQDGGRLSEDRQPVTRKEKVGLDQQAPRLPQELTLRSEGHPESRTLTGISPDLRDSRGTGHIFHK